MDGESQFEVGYFLDVLLLFSSLALLCIPQKTGSFCNSKDLVVRSNKGNQHGIQWK